MKLNVGSPKLVNKFVAIALSLLLCQPTFAITPSSTNNQMAFEGTLTDQNGNPINLAGATLNFYISANGCYLYGESSTVAGDSQGNIIHSFGSGTVAAGSPNSFSQNLFFGNVTGTTTFAGNNCSVTASDTRLAQVYYPAQNITGTIKLGTVPYAANATMLDGKASTDFVLANADTMTVFSGGGTTGQYLTKGVSGLTWTTNTLTAAQVQSALGYTPASATTSITATQITSALGYTPAASAALTANQVTTALGYTPANSATLANYALRANNLSDLTSATAARTNLGLGSLAIKNSVDLATVDVTGTLPASRLPSFSGDVSTGVGSSVTTVQALHGVAISATGPVSGQVLLFNGTAWTPTTVPSGIGTVTNVSSANSDISVTNSTTTPVLTLNAGTTANQIIKLDASARLPSVDASNLINLNASQLTSGTISAQRLPAFTGDVLTSAGSNTTTLAKIRGIDVATTAPVSGQVMMFTNGKWTPINPTLGTVTAVTAGNGLLGGTITSAGTLSVNFGTTSGSAAAGNDSRIVGALQSVNNLGDIASATMARTNLGLGNLATKNTVNLVSDVTGVLPLANGGSPWLQGVGGIYSVSNTTIGSSTTFTNVPLYVFAPIMSGTVATSIQNSNSDGYGLKINVDSASSSQYGLRVSSFNSTTFVVLNNGNTGMGLAAPSARLHIAGGSTSTPGLKLNSGALLGTLAAGAIENDGSRLYYTDDTNFRRNLVMGNSTNAIDNINNVNATGNITMYPQTGSVIVSSSIASSDYQSGALIVKGGIGINGNGNFSGGVNAAGSIAASGSITSWGAISTTNNIIAAGTISPYIYGGTTSGVTLSLDSTSNASKGNVVIATGGGNVGVGLVNPTYRFQVKSPGLNSNGMAYTPTTGSGMIAFGEDVNGLNNIAYDTAGQPRWFFTVSGTNYLNNDVAIGNTTALPNSKLSVYGNLTVAGNAVVSKTLTVTNSTTAPAILFGSSNLTLTAVANAVESDGSNLFYTNGATIRRRLAGGVVSGTIDNTNKISYGGGNLILEGNSSAAAGVAINNIGGGAVGLQVNGQTVVSGSIKLAGDGTDTTTTCTTTDEGKQRYNKTFKTMEFCDGANWQGVLGVTYCDSGWTLMGTPGTPAAYCVEVNANAASNYPTASVTCKSKTVNRRSKPAVCTVAQLDQACEGNALAMNNVVQWTSNPASGNQNYTAAYAWTGAACHVIYNSGSDYGRYMDIFTVSNSYNYRCCYQ